MKNKLNSKKFLFQALLLAGFLFVTLAFAFFGIKYQASRNKAEAFTIRTGADQACFDQWCNDAVAFFCDLNTEAEVQQAMNGSWGCGAGGHPATRRVEIGNQSVANYIPSNYCGYWQIDCNHNIDGCDSNGNDFIGGFDSSGCGPVSQPYCGDGVVNNGEQCEPGVANSCGDGQTCNNSCQCQTNDEGGGEEEPACPYSSTEARVQCEPWQSCPWRQTLTIDQGDTFRVGSFHNATDTFASDTRLVVTDPSGAQVADCRPNGNAYSCNSTVVTGSQTGTYTLRVTTPGQSGTACRAQATVTVRSGQNPNYEIVKDVTDSDNFYFINDTINFRVVIRNTGQVTLNSIPFRDNYDASKIDYVSASGRKSGGTDVSLNFSVNESTGRITHTDLTSQLGDLAPGENYIITFRYRALADSSRTCNIAFVNPDNLGEESDDACISINRPPDL